MGLQSMQLPAVWPLYWTESPDRQDREIQRTEATRVLDVDLLQSNFESIVELRTWEFADRVYDRLFQHHPELAPLFQSSMERQNRHFVIALRTVVSSLRHPEEAAGLLKSLGSAHAGYGVQAEHYQLFCENLVAVLSDMAGDNWTPKLEQTWRDGFREVQRIVLQDLSLDAGENAVVGSLDTRSDAACATHPLPDPPDSDPLAVASEYLELNRRWQKDEAAQ